MAVRLGDHLHHDIAVLAVHRGLLGIVGVCSYPRAQFIAPIGTDMGTCNPGEWRGVGRTAARREGEVEGRGCTARRSPRGWRAQLRRRGVEGEVHWCWEFL